MNQLFKERPLVKTGILALLLVPLLALLNDYSPPKEKIPEGYNSSIIAFEFVSDQKELGLVLGPLSEKEMDDLDLLNYVDYGFMVLYGTFLFLFMAKLGGLTGDSLLIKGKWLAPMVVISDAIENVQLLKLTDYFRNAVVDIDFVITLLGIFTWLKWGLLALAFAMIGKAMTHMHQSKWVGYILLMPISLGVLAFVTGMSQMEDLFGTSVFVAFFIIFIYCLVFRSSSPHLSKNA